METQAFVYKWIHIPTLKWYVGSRSKLGCHPNDGYICSSKIVKPMIESNPSEWRREIISIGEIKEMRALEKEILKLADARFDIRSFNQSNAVGFNSTGNRKGSTISEEHKKILSESNKNRIKTKESIEACRQKLLGRKRPEWHKEAMRKPKGPQKNPNPSYGNRKLTDDQIREFRKEYCNAPIKKIVKQKYKDLYRISFATLQDIIANRTWRHIK